MISWQRTGMEKGAATILPHNANGAEGHTQVSCSTEHGLSRLKMYLSPLNSRHYNQGLIWPVIGKLLSWVCITGIVLYPLNLVAYNDNATISRRMTTSVLESLTYSDCPFIATGYSQYLMAQPGPFESDIDDLTNSTKRAYKALSFLNEHQAYHRVVKALESGAFDGRKVMLDGDSLTTELFVTLGCMCWEAGYVESYDFHYAHWDEYSSFPTPGAINAGYTGPGNKPASSSIVLKGGGEIYFTKRISIEPRRRMDQMLDVIVDSTCNSDALSENSIVQGHHDYKAQYLRDDGESEIPMSQNDVQVFSAGHHSNAPAALVAFHKIFQCMKERSNKFDTWPHFVYQLPTIRHFQTQGGVYGGKRIEGANRMTCAVHAPTGERDRVKSTLMGLVPFIGDFNLADLGELHVWHGDCLHWIMPGVQDVYAADLADYMLHTSNITSLKSQM